MSRTTSAPGSADRSSAAGTGKGPALLALSFAVLATLAAAGWMLNESTRTVAIVPDASYYAAETSAQWVAPSDPVPVEASLAANETVMPQAPPAAPAPHAAPAKRAKGTKPHLAAKTPPRNRVEIRRVPLDRRIQSEVIGALTRAPSIHGRIGVESKDAVVTLRGWTATPGEARRAGLIALQVKDVKVVENYLRPRIGGSS
jgi:hypothetical protein